MIYIDYDREKAVRYAKKWALKRNPEFYDYSKIGGDCTSFASQCVYAGCPIMNYEKDFGWYYIDSNDKSPSWTGVSYFYNFMTQNEGVGPYGEETTLRELKLGDIIQLGDKNNNFYHSLVLTKITDGFRGRRYYVCAHSIDVYQKNLYSYDFYQMRCIHILGGRKKD